VPFENPHLHRIYAPQEVWVVEEPDGFTNSIEILRADGTREVVTVRKVGLWPLS
jgi:putative heme degradation protein